MSSARMPPSFISREMTEEIEAVLLIRTHLRLDARGQLDVGNAFEVGELFAQRFGFGRVGEALQAPLHRSARPVRDRCAAATALSPSRPRSAIVSCACCTASVSSSIQPASGNFTKRPVAAGEPLQIGRRQLQSFLFPFGGNGEPVDAAALDDQLGLELARRQEQPMKGRVAEILGFLRAVRPGVRERVEKIFVRVADPQARLGREPIEPAQPLRRGFEPRVFEDFRLVRVLARCGRVELPFLAGPMPVASVALAAWRSKRRRTVSSASSKINCGTAVCATQSCSQSTPFEVCVRRSCVRRRWLSLRTGMAGVSLQYSSSARRRRVAQQIKVCVHQGQRRLAGEKLRLAQVAVLAVRQRQSMGEGQVRCRRFPDAA